jgi:hypothetical protein
VKWITTNTKGNSSGSTVSDGNGRFSIDTVGKVLDVTVQKDGYRSSDGHQGFEFANFTDPNYYNSDREHPVVFHLRKIPPAEPIYIWSGSSDKGEINVKTSINPKTGKLSQGESPEGIWVEFVPGPDNAPGREQYNLILGTGASGGVAIAANGADPVAPESSYNTLLDPHVIIGFKGDGEVQKKVFFKDGTGNYGMAYLDIDLLPNQLIYNQQLTWRIHLSYTIMYNPGGGRSFSAPQGSQYQINR